MPKQKKIAYKKCHQCRKDRQKCLPENRNWPGTKCDRCQHYNYECSAMRTKGEESSMTSSARASNLPDTPIRTGSASPPIQRSEFRCLQELGDLQQLSMSFFRYFIHEGMEEFLCEALSDAVEETMIWARRHEADGRYRDAEYLIRRTNSFFHGENPLKHMWSHLNEDVLPTMVSIYEKMGDYTAAEMCQEKLVRQLFAEIPEQGNEEQIQAVATLSRLLSNFQKRILDLVPNFGAISQVYRDLFITYRAAVLDIYSLNESLLEQGLINFEPRKEHFCMSLHIAAKENAINLARQLIEMGADVNSEDWESQKPLHIAAAYAGSEMIGLLLDNQAKIEAVNGRGYTPLRAAVVGKRPQETVAFLVNAKADINARNDLGVTALSLAIRFNLQGIASLLLEQGANVEGFDDDEGLLFPAVRFQKTWAIDLLLDNGANLLKRNKKGYTVLDVAVTMNLESTVQILLDRGEKTNPACYGENDYEDMVLHLAIRGANVSIVEMLLKARVGIHARDYNGYTALQQAIVGGREPHERIVQLLLELDAVRMQCIDSDGHTALHLAVSYSRRKMLVILLQHKPDELPILCQMNNIFGRTPLDVARALAKGMKESSDEKSVLYLLEEGLKLSHSLFNATAGQGD